MQNKFENAIIVRRTTRMEQLKQRFNTEEQAKFYIKQNKVAFTQKKVNLRSAKEKVSFEEEAAEMEEAKISAEKEYKDYESEDQRFNRALDTITKEVSKYLKVRVLDLTYLPNYIFSKKDMIIVLGQDGLVANTAKYAGNQPIIGVNPDPERYDGKLLNYQISNFMLAVTAVINGTYNFKKVAMAEVTLNDGQSMLAFNDFFIGINSHASAYYKIDYKQMSEYQGSSGIIVSTGAGSTGWFSSFFNMINGVADFFDEVNKFEYMPWGKDERLLKFIVREPFISQTTKAQIVYGSLYEGEILKLESTMPQNGIIFSDGIQSDFLQFNSGTIAEIKLSSQSAVLIQN